MVDITKVNEIKCCRCIHDEICILKEDMLTLSGEIYELKNVKGNKHFKVCVECNYFNGKALIR